MDLFQNKKFLSEVYLRNNLCVNEDFLVDSAIDSISEKLATTCEFETRVKLTFNSIKFPISIHPVNAFLSLLAVLVILVVILTTLLCFVAIYRRTCARRKPMRRNSDFY